MDATSTERAGRAAGGRRPWVFGLLILVLLFVAFPKVMLGLHAFVYRDYGVLGYPFVHYSHECFWRGELPLWNPYSNCGAPFLAQWGTMTLYPGSLIYLLLPLPWSLGIFCLLHLALGGAGMFALARCWLGSEFEPATEGSSRGGSPHRSWLNADFAPGAAGLAYVFCGTTFSCLMWPNYTVALGWMPWVVLLVERSWRAGGRWLAGAALAGAMQLLSGVPEIVLLTWLLLATLLATELAQSRGGRVRLAWRFGVVGLLVAGLAAAQLLPFFELLEHSQRDKSFVSSKWPMPLWGLANLLVPLFHCQETAQGPYVQTGQHFFSSYYPGAAVLVLAVSAVAWVRHRRVWMLAGLAVFSLMMAWGENGFLYPLVKRAIPLLGVARYPIKFVLLAAFALPLLAAFAVRELGRTDAEETRRRRFVVLLGSVTVALMGGLVWMAWSHPLQSAQWSAKENAFYALTEWQFVGRNALGRAACLAGTLAVALALARAQVARSRLLLGGTAILLVLGDVLTHMPPQNPTVPAEAFARNLLQAQNKTEFPRLGEGRVLISPGAEQRLLRDARPEMMADFLGKRLGLWSNLNLLEGVPKVNGSSTLQVREQMQVQSLIYGETNRFESGLLEMLGVRWFSPMENPTRWIAFSNACPLISAGQAPVFAGAEETLRALAGQEFNPREQVYLSPEVSRGVSVTNRCRATVRAAKWTAHAVEAEVEADAPSLVVICQSHYPGWRAAVGGRPVPLLRANHAFQAIEVPVGRHQVRVVYSDRQFLAGAGVSLATLVGCGWILLRRRSRRLETESTSDASPKEPWLEAA